MYCLTYFNASQFHLLFILHSKIIIMSISLCNPGVSKAILDAAGVQVEQECSQIGLYSLNVLFLFVGVQYFIFLNTYIFGIHFKTDLMNFRCHW